MRSFLPADPDGKISRASYVVEAALEYFVTLILSDLFLSALMTEVGMSTALQGTVTAIGQTAAMLQLLGVLLIRRRVGVKRFVTLTCLFSQLSLALVYFTPMFSGLSANGRSILLALFLLLGYGSVSLISPFRAAWMMSNVPDHKRGRFTAIKEIVSLYSGFAFSFLMGRVLDAYRAAGNMRGFFLFAGFSILIISIPHTLSLILVREPAQEQALPEEKPVGFFENLARSFRVTLGSRNFRLVIPIFVLYYFSVAAANFYGVYKLNVLLFTATYSAILMLIQSVVRSVVSIPFGRIADKTSWATLLTIVVPIAALGYLFAASSVPENGRWCFAIYMVLNGMAMGGLNSAMFNIAFDYVPHEDRTDALAWLYAIGGISTLLGTLGESALASYIEKNGNRFLGLSVYPQQVFSVISAICLLLLVAYVRFFLLRKKGKGKEIPKGENPG